MNTTKTEVMTTRKFMVIETRVRLRGEAPEIKIVHGEVTCIDQRPRDVLGNPVAWSDEEEAGWFSQAAHRVGSSFGANVPVVPKPGRETYGTTEKSVRNIFADSDGGVKVVYEIK